MAASEFNYEHDPSSDMYRVTLRRDGFSASTWVSSIHLVEEKRGQLEAAINRMAADTYGNDSASAA